MSTLPNNSTLVSLTSSRASAKTALTGKILLVKPPYFTPWTPPLGIGILKSYLAQHDYSARCFDFNTEPELWGMHHKYFAALQALEDVSINDGYSKLWWILNAHMLAYSNGADAPACRRVLETVIPLYGIGVNNEVINHLLVLIEGFYKRLDDVLESLDLSDYSVVGTSTYTTSLGPSLFLLRKLKQKYPHLTTVMGGGIFADDLALGSDNLDTLLVNYPFVEHVILGEGELLFLKLIQGEFSHKRVISIADLKGETLQMKDVPSPDFSDLNIADYYHLSIEGARSCPFQCSFCSETIQWGDYRKKPIELFAQQVIELARHNEKNSFFMGDSLMNPYILQFSGELLDKQANILYDGYLRADKPVTHRDRVEQWARSGLYRARLGIESASARVLDSMDKMTTPQVISTVLKTLANAGIRPTTYWIVGFPGETEEDFEETLQFIRENHPYIYELEAHPYYYYPYGQIGSRLHQCESLYPDDVTEIIKFRMWDIIDCQPTRLERYDRLRRIAKLSADLGLPNIYTMADRYIAEDRWHRLHPLTVEVYEGTRLVRDEVRLPDHPVEIFSPQWNDVQSSLISNAASVVCHKLRVDKPLDEGVLSASIVKLIQANEMLQMSLENGMYVAASVEAPSPDTELLSVHTRGEEADDDPANAEIRILEKTASQMRPLRGSSLRVVLINHQDATSTLLVLAHRAIADSRSLILLCEDLFRIYENLARDKEVSLRPIRKTYTRFITELRSPKHPRHALLPQPSSISRRGDNPARATTGNNQKTETLSVELEENLFARMSSEILKSANFKPAEMLVAAVLKCLKQQQLNSDVSVRVLMDSRFLDEDLEHTVGTLTRSYPLPQETVSSAPSLHAVRRMLEQIPFETGDESTNVPSAQQILLNLEYLCGEPWLGGDQWQSQGFVISETELAETFTLELIPVATPGGMRILLKYRSETPTALSAAKLAHHLASTLESVLDEAEEEVAATSFWLRLFSTPPPAFNLDPQFLLTTATTLSAAAPSHRALQAASCRFPAAHLARLCASFACEPTTLLLAVCATVLARFSGHDEVVIATYEARTRALMPLRLRPSWHAGMGETVATTGAQLAAGRQYAKQGLEVVSRLQWNVEAGEGDRERGVTLDVVYVQGAGSGGEREAERLVRELQGEMASEGQMASEGKIWLVELAGEGGAVELWVVSEAGVMREGSGAELARRIEEAVAGEVAAELKGVGERAEVSGRGQGVEVRDELAAQTFNFD
ncbi:MAG TPA: radical SAM protein [Pyrinomonadaceae bacterium]|nr:radical SAM protein [Pyrinomonadaceae bacterium]